MDSATGRANSLLTCGGGCEQSHARSATAADAVLARQEGGASIGDRNPASIYGQEPGDDARNSIARRSHLAPRNASSGAVPEQPGFDHHVVFGGLALLPCRRHLLCR